MEEAARLFYVVMTRAKKHLELIAYRERDGEKTTESRFITAVRDILNLPGKKGTRPSVSNNEWQSDTASESYNPAAIRDPLELRTGQMVTHSVFGRGLIIQLGAGQVHIEFKSGVKTLCMATCLEKGLLVPSD